MSTWMIVLLSAVVGFVLAMIVVRATKGTAAPPPTRLPADLDRVPVSSEVIGFIAQGEKIRAIKQLRIETNLGLKDAKDVVEHAERQYHAALQSGQQYGDPTH